MSNENIYTVDCFDIKTREIIDFYETTYWGEAVDEYQRMSKTCARDTLITLRSNGILCRSKFI